MTGAGAGAAARSAISIGGAFCCSIATTSRCGSSFAGRRIAMKTSTAATAASAGIAIRHLRYHGTTDAAVALASALVGASNIRQHHLASHAIGKMRFETLALRRGDRPVAVCRNRFRVRALGRRRTRLRAHRPAQDRVERLVILVGRRHVFTIPYSLNEPRPENCTVRVDSFDVRERARQVDLQIARSPIITQPNLVLAQAGRRRAASVRSRL